MADRWIALCGNDYVEDIKRAANHVSRDARLTFSTSPQDLRHRIQEEPLCLGVLVGPLDSGVSSLNVAAALAHDAMATDVVLVVRGQTPELARRAERAGIHTVVDVLALPPASVADLDEPELCDDDMPTMVLGVHIPWEPKVEEVPLVEDEVEPFGTQLLSVPLYEEPKPKSLGAAATAGRDARPKEDADRAPVITFVSGRGGVGKTSTVALMAVAAASWGMRVALCDLDLSCGNLYSLFGQRAEADLARAVGDETYAATDLMDIGREVSKGITLWGPCERPEMAELVFPVVEELLSKLSAHYDLVLVDTSSTFTDAVAQAAQQCDRLVITVDGRFGSVAAQSRLAALAVRLGVARTRIVRLANRCGSHGKGEPIINRADVGLETARPFRVLDGGADVGDCLAEGKVGELFELGSRFAESCATTLARLLSELGKLPDHEGARRALESRLDKPRWSFGRKREAV